MSPPIAPLTFDAARSPLLFYAAPIAPAAHVDASNPKWIQLCAVGSYVYRGTPVEITAATFDAMIANFRAHPAYKPEARTLFGADVNEAQKLGVAVTSGVVALNFDHPPQGAPRPGHGWFLELERRGGELWGLVWMDPDAHTGMLAMKWKWTSIEWSGAAVDNKGAEIGPYLSGVALTNDPFVQGMTPIQMARPKEPGPVVWFGGVATDMLCELRGLFGLPETADVGAVIGEIAKLRVWAMGEAPAPIGVDVPALVGRARCLLNLPTLADPANIFAELSKLLGRVAEEQETQEPTMPLPNDPKNPTSTEPGALARALAPALSAILRSPVEPTDEGVTRHFNGAMARYDEAVGHVMALQKMFQTTDPKALNEKMAALMGLSDQVSALLGEVQAEHAAEEKAEGEMAQADAMQVMQAQRLDPKTAHGTLVAYTAQRQGYAPPLTFPTAEQVKADPALFAKVLADVRARRAARRDNKAAFFKAHGIEAIIPVPAHLQALYGQNYFAGPGAAFNPGNVGPLPPQGGAPPPPYQGAQFGGHHGAPPPAPNGWSWARVGALPMSTRGDNPAQRVFEEVARSEFNSDVNGARYDQAWARANSILANITKNEGPAPVSFGN